MSDTTQPGNVPAPGKPALFSRLATAVVYAVTGRGPSWFGPAEPIAPQAPPGIGGRQFDFPTATNLTTSPRQDEDVSAEQLRALAENCDVLRLVIETRKDQLCGQTWQFQLKDKSARGKTPDKRLGVLAAFFETPDGEHCWEEWIRPLLDDMFVLDAATLFPRRTMGGGIYGFEFVDGGTIKRVIDDFGRTPLPPAPAYQQVLKGLPAVNYTREELLYLPRNLRSYKLYGLSQVQQVAMTVNVALRRQLHQLEYYTAGTIPDALAGVPETWSVEQIGDFQRYWDELLTGDQASRRRVRFVPGGIAKGFTQTKEAALKDEFDEWLARIVSYAFSVSPQWAVKQINRATAETASGMANAEGLAPLMQWVKRVIDRCIVAGWGWHDIEFAWHEEMETNPAEQMTVSTGYLKVGVLTINQVLADIGRDPIEGGDVNLIYTPTGAVPLSVALAPPPPPPQIGHNGGPVMGGADAPKPDEADAQEQLLKAAGDDARLGAIWSHFLAHEAPRVAQAIAALLPDSMQKAAGDETGDKPADEPSTFDDLADASRIADQLAPRAVHTGAPAVPQNVTEAIDKAVAAMPWPAVQASSSAMLETAATAGVSEGMQDLAKIAGITVKDATRLANPHAIAAAQAQAADLVRGVSDTTRAALNRVVSQAIAEGWSTQQLIDRIVADHAFSEDRALLIARTELKRAQSLGKIDSWRASSRLSGVAITKRVILGMNENHCIACRSAVLEGAIPIEDSWEVGFAPPFHPACYCVMVPGVSKPS